MSKVTEKTEDMVKLRVPKEPGGEEMLFVALNGQSYNIPRGKVVEVPASIAAVYYESIAATETAISNSEEFQADMKIIHGAP